MCACVGRPQHLHKAACCLLPVAVVALGSLPHLWINARLAISFNKTHWAPGTRRCLLILFYFVVVLLLFFFEQCSMHDSDNSLLFCCLLFANSQQNINISTLLHARQTWHKNMAAPDLLFAAVRTRRFVADGHLAESAYSIASARLGVENLSFRICS